MDAQLVSDETHQYGSKNQRMHDAERFKLRFGRYRTPGSSYGAIVECAVHGPMKIVGLTNGRIPWPLGRPPEQIACGLQWAGQGRADGSCNRRAALLRRVCPSTV
jgi:hypothetical protein